MADDKKKKGSDKDDKKKSSGQAKGAAPAKGGQAKPAGKSAGKGKKDDKAKGSAVEETVVETDPNYVPRLRAHYKAAVVPALTTKFSYKNPMMVPRLLKVTINMGLGAAVQTPKIIDTAVEDMTALSGQKPVVTRARKSIATFKLRENLPIGVMVTLRRDRMWEFVDRLITFSLARVRDFRGVSPKGFDGKGNFTMGLKEQIIFPEIDYDKVDSVKGMNITFVTTARTDEEGRAFLTELGIPFRK